MANIDDRKFLQHLGEHIRELREARGLTQQQLGDACKLHRTFVGSVERGERNIAVLGLRRMARALRVSLAELFA